MNQALEPFDIGRLDVGDGHVLHYEQVGNPDGRPILYLHGGPGSGCSLGARDHFDPERHRGILFDQRASGRSTPYAADPLGTVDWASIDLEHHVADIEHLREHLAIERWAVTGYSWGSVLAVAYAERHPQRVTAVVVGAVSTGTHADIEWLTVDAGRFFPEQWYAFTGYLPAHLRAERIVDAYHALLFDPDPAVHEAAAAAWCRWEDAHVATTPGATPDPRYDDPRFRLAFARQVTHCWRNDSWLTDDELVRNAHRLAGVPGVLVHGRLDLSGPLMGPWRLHRAWEGSRLVVVDDEGHGGDAMFDEVRRALRELV